MRHRGTQHIATPRLIVVIALAFYTATGVAQEQSHIDAARELLILMQEERAFEQTFDQIKPNMAIIFSQMDLPESQLPRLDRYTEKMLVAMREEITWEAMEPLLIEAYTSVYAEDEMQELSKFYTSPIGRKLIARKPELAEATTEVSRQMLARFMPRLKEIQEEMKNEILDETEDHTNEERKLSP